jgi:hypothetical protein
MMANIFNQRFFHSIMMLISKNINGINHAYAEIMYEYNEWN